MLQQKRSFRELLSILLVIDTNKFLVPEIGTLYLFARTVCLGNNLIVQRNESLFLGVKSFSQFPFVSSQTT